MNQNQKMANLHDNQRISKNHNSSGYQPVDQIDHHSCDPPVHAIVDQNELFPAVNSSATVATLIDMIKEKENSQSMESSLFDETTSDDLLKSFLGLLYIGILFYAFLWLDSEDSSRTLTGPLELGVNSISLELSHPHHETINTSFLIKNHHNFSSIFFEEIEASLSYRGILLSTTYLSRFYMEKQGPVELEAGFLLQSSAAPVVETLMEEWKEHGMVGFDMRLQGLVKITSVPFGGKEAWFRGFCWNAWGGRNGDGSKYLKGCQVFFNGWDGEIIDSF